jgi:hypothetical protein
MNSELSPGNLLAPWPHAEESEEPRVEPYLRWNPYEQDPYHPDPYAPR